MYRYSRVFLALGIPGLVFLLGQGISSAQDEEKPMPEDPAVEVQARGPLHEAFAQPYQDKLGPTPLVPKQPPEPIPELPPDQKPEGDNVQWVPGYWAWDSDRKDYIWVSGGYRNAPQGQKYVPGYWNQTEEGWRWVPGFWTSGNQEELQYVPEPPASLENGPSIPSPEEDSLYVPGYWYYQNSLWAWRPGYWTPAYSNRIWIPARHVWTPYGYIFNNGYWDCPFEDTGLLFAPVYFNRPLWLTADWCYRPYYALNWNPILNSLFFCRPYGSFYFGSYYGPAYAGLGYRPWYSGYRWDPYSSYYRWNNRGNPNWYGNMQQLYAAREAGKLQRPPLTLAQQNALLPKSSKGNPLNMVSPLNQVKNENIRLTSLSPKQLELQKNNIQQFRDLSKNRSSFESAKVKGGKTFQLPESFKSAGVVTPTSPKSLSPKTGNPGPKGPPKVLTGKGPESQPKQGVVGRPTSPKVEPKIDTGKNIPKVTTPKTDPGKTVPTPKVTQPKTDPGKTITSPKTTTPKTDPGKTIPTPKVNQPKSDPGKTIPAPKITTPKTDPGGATPKVTPKVETPKVNPPKANPPKANPPKGNPKGGSKSGITGQFGAVQPPATGGNRPPALQPSTGPKIIQSAQPPIRNINPQSGIPGQSKVIPSQVPNISKGPGPSAGGIRPPVFQPSSGPKIIPSAQPPIRNISPPQASKGPSISPPRINTPSAPPRISTPSQPPRISAPPPRPSGGAISRPPGGGFGGGGGKGGGKGGRK